MRRILFIATFIALLVFAFFIGTKTGVIFPLNTLFNRTAAETNDESDPGDAEPYPEEEPEPDLRTVNVVIVGNIFPHLPQIEQAYVEEGIYDFSPSFEIIAPLLQAADLAIGDLETSQAGPDISFIGYSGYSGFPCFNTPQELSVALQEAGIDILTLANNHALDRGLDGLMVTLDHLRRIGIGTFGAYKSQEERDIPLIVEHDGIKIALIGYTFSTNGIPVPEGHEYCVNFTPGFEDITPIIADIETARNNGADLVAIFTHWGDAEYAAEPQPQYLRQVAAELASVGADLIIGGHAKFVQPIEWFFNEREDGTERTTLAIYAQGTFLSNQHYPNNPSPHVEYGLILDLDLTKNMDSGEAWISGVDYEITWVHRLWRHRILPLSAVFAGSPQEYNLTESKVEELKTWYQRTIDNAEAYGHTAAKARALEISESLFDKAHNN